MHRSGGWAGTPVVESAGPLAPQPVGWVIWAAMTDRDTAGLVARVLTVSDGVIAGTRKDESGDALVELLVREGYRVDDRRAIEDGVESVRDALVDLSSGFAGLVVTTGGTGFGPRDLTPEGTAAVVERRADGLAEATRLVTPFGRLSRAIAGTRGTALIVNLPGSPKGAVECLEAVLDVIPHALRLLADQPTEH